LPFALPPLRPGEAAPLELHPAILEQPSSRSGGSSSPANMEGFANDGSFLQKMMLAQGGAASASSSAAPAPAAPGGAARAGAPEPPAAVLSAAEQIAARIAAKSKDQSKDQGSRDQGGKKRKFSEAVDAAGSRRRDESSTSAVALVPGGAPTTLEEGQEEVVSSWGRIYKAGHVPKSSSISNLLPDEEMKKYTTLLPGAKKPEPAEAKETIKIESSNIGHKLLSKMGWKAGKGLGAQESGKVAPVAEEAGVTGRSGVLAGDMKGVGGQHTWDLDGNEDIYEQFRKRSMLAYRYRPNPDGNPRNLYY